MKQAMFRLLWVILLLNFALPAGSLRAQNPSPTQPTTSRPPFSTGRPAPDARKAERDAAEAAEIKQDLAEALTTIQKYYINSDLNYEDLYKSSINGMLHSLDPHSAYYDAKDFAEMQASYSSQYFGIGATIGSRRVGKDIDTYVLATFEDAPAARAGLRYGDRIVAVDDWDADNRNSAEVRDKLRGPRGTPVKVTVERAADGQRQTVNLTRDAVPQPTVPDAYMIRPGVGYIDFTRAFHFTSANEFRAALDDLNAQGMTSLVLDLRGNGGGLLDQAVRIASAFVPSGKLIVSQGGRASGRREYRSIDPRPQQMPMVVLVDRNTASAGEILAGALQDHDRALLVGQPTFGKGLVQSVMPMDYGTALTLTTSKYYTPSGRVVQRYYSPDESYTYYTRGGIGATDDSSVTATAGSEHKTASGRSVFDGLGIVPDHPVKPRTITTAQFRMLDPIFEFTRELVSGRVAGFENFKRQEPISFGHHLGPNELVVTEELFQKFKQFVAQKYSDRFPAKQIDASRAYLLRQLRSEIVTASYGLTTAAMVFIADDPQLLKALEVMPQAAQLAAASRRTN